MLDAESVMLKFVQKQIYTEEVRALNWGQSVKRRSSLRQLDTYIDNGILNSR